MKLDARLSLAVFLHRMAHNTSVGQIASRFGISEGSVVNCFQRTLESMLDALKDEVSWPDQQRRDIIKDGFVAMGILPGAVGAVDGSHLRLQSKPQGVPNPLAYYCRHDHYSINLIVICDHEKNVIDFSAAVYRRGWEEPLLILAPEPLSKITNNLSAA